MPACSACQARHRRFAKYLFLFALNQGSSSLLHLADYDKIRGPRSPDASSRDKKDAVVSGSFGAQEPYVSDGISMSRFTAEDVVDITAVAVMGVTGSGKSNFIRLASKCDKSIVGHNLESCTPEIKSYEFLHEGRRVLLFDTPGFDDTYRLDADILAELAETLSAMYKNRLKLAGIIYMHRIKDERMTNSIMRNLSLIRNLCGDAPLKNVMLVTSFWDELPSQARGEQREQELVSRREWWGYMVSRGSNVKRFRNNEASALEILDQLIDKPRVTLEIQKEMVDQGLDMFKTKAGAALNKELAELTMKHQTELARLETEMKTAMASHDAEMQEVLAIEREMKQRQLDRLQHENEATQRDRREEMRRMEQHFQDTLFRLVEDRKEREAQITVLEERLTRERVGSEARLRDALARSDEQIATLTEQMKRERREDGRVLENQLARLQAERERVAKEHERWVAQVDALNAEIRRLTIEQQGADQEEKTRLEARIQELERQKQSKGRFIAGIAARLLASAVGPVLGFMFGV